MDSNDVKKLWALLAELYPRQKQAETKERLAAWALAMEPYDYDAIKAAAVAHARKSDYYPSISEIVANLPPPDKNAWMDEIIEENDRRKRSGAIWQGYITGNGLDADNNESVSRYAREHDMTWPEAKEALQNGT